VRILYKSDWWLPVFTVVFAAIFLSLKTAEQTFHLPFGVGPLARILEPGLVPRVFYAADDRGLEFRALARFQGTNGAFTP